MPNHVQCKLQKSGGDTQFSWLPDKYAHRNAVVKLKNDDGTWDDGWIILETYSEMPSTFIRERGQDYKKMRQMTDI